jgi:DNA polymerase I
MLQFPNGGRLIELASELPVLRGFETLYADFETTSQDPRVAAVNPWHKCWAAGVAVTVDDLPGAWYVPTMHMFGPRVDHDAVVDWWLGLLYEAKRWANQHVKFDAHVSANALGALYDVGELYCTLNHAKIVDSDRRNYGLDALSLDWLGEDISRYEAALAPYLVRNKDYGRIPADVAGEYACQDVLTTRRLRKFIEQTRPKECDGVAQMETKLTRVLFEMERVGMRVDPVELATTEVQVIHEMLGLEQQIKEIVGRYINPVSPKDCYDVLINQYGLPILAWTEEPEDEDDEPEGNPSFNKDALKLYLEHPYAPKELVQLIIDDRQLSTFRSLFLEQYQELLTEDLRLHSSYNQTVRTGRMGCKKPNAQQLNKRAKSLIHPPHGWAFLSYDFSQIEFRLIAEIIDADEILAAYARDPDTDFHQLVADMNETKRKPAKTLNFMMGYGGGRKKAVKTLKGITEVIGDVKAEVDRLVMDGAIDKADEVRAFDVRCEARAERMYERYHAMMPNLKRTSRHCAAVCKARGYVFNRMGRRRHLPPAFAHKAFNSLCQGWAADIQKERTVALHDALRGTPIQMVANVHDETLLQGPTEVMRDRRTQISIAWLLEHPRCDLEVPLRVSCGLSEQHWAEACTDAKDGGPSGPLHYAREEREWLLDHAHDPLYFLRPEHRTEGAVA